MVYQTNSEAETIKLAGQLAKELTPKNHIFTLTGPLGAGKTTFAKGFAEGLGITDSIISPTFVLIRQHSIPSSDKVMFHIDLYRLEKSTNWQELGLSELFNNPDAVVLIEWPERLDKLPEEVVNIKIDKLDENSRKLTVISP